MIPKIQRVAPAFGLRWSSDGRSFYVAGMDEGGPDIFRVDGQTGDASSLFGSHHEPGWAAGVEELPQADSFILLRHEYQKQADEELVFRNNGTGQERVLFHLARPAWINGFAVSVDGRQVAFTTANEPGDSSTLRLVPVSGGDARVLLQSKSPELFENGSLAWTRDGSQIVFVETDGRLTHAKSELMEISANGGEPRDLGLSLPRMRRIGIHPDGHRIVFQTHSITGEVWVIRNLFAKAANSR